MLRFDEDDFVQWRESEITKLVLDEILAQEQTRCRDASQQKAWEMNLDLVLHACLRERHSTIEQIRNLKYSDLESIKEDE